MKYDDFIKLIGVYKAAVRTYKNGQCLCGSYKPRLYHFSLYKKDDALVIYCDHCSNKAKPGVLRELDEKEYFIVQIQQE